MKLKDGVRSNEGKEKIELVDIFSFICFLHARFLLKCELMFVSIAKYFSQKLVRVKNKFLYLHRQKILNMLRNQLHIDVKRFSPIGYNLCGACGSSN